MSSFDTAQSGRERITVSALRVTGLNAHSVDEILAAEEPLEIQLAFGSRQSKRVKPISVTMRTPGNDDELALGFLLSEGVIRDIDEIERTVSADEGVRRDTAGPARHCWTTQNAVRIELAVGIEPNVSTLERNFYTTSSCGVCGKASLLALRAVCPPRLNNNLTITSDVLYKLHPRLRAAQSIFSDTGGIHSAALFDPQGNLLLIREDVGRHNAVDKLVGACLFADQLPLRNRLLFLSGRASFELMQKALMAGIPMVVSVGAPSSLAVAIARDFDITLAGFLREDHFNIYHGAERIKTLPQTAVARPT